MNQVKLWTKGFVNGTLINFFLMLNYYLIMVVITDYAMKEFGESPSLAGFTASVFVIGALIARLFCGKYLEQIGRKRMVIAGAVLMLIMSLLYFFASNGAVMLLVRFFHGVSYGVGATAISTIVTDIIPRERQGEGIGYYMLSITMAAAIGPFLGMFLVHHGGFSTIFLFCTAAAILCLLCAFLLKAPEGRFVEKPVAAGKKKGIIQWSNFIEKKALPISLVSALIYFGYSSLISFLTPFTGQIHLETAASFFFVIYAVAILATRPFIGRLFDTKGERITMIPAFLIFCVGMVLLSQAHNGVILLVAAAMLGFGVGVVQSCGLAIAVQCGPVDRLSLINSTFYMMLDIGVGIGPMVLGLLIPYSGYRGMYLVMAGVALLCLVLYYIIWKRKQEAAVPAAAPQSVH